MRRISAIGPHLAIIASEFATLAWVSLALALAHRVSEDIHVST